MMAMQYRVADINHMSYFMIGDSVWAGYIHVAKVYANTIQKKSTDYNAWGKKRTIPQGKETKHGIIRGSF